MDDPIIIEWITGGAIAAISFLLGWYARGRKQRQGTG